MRLATIDLETDPFLARRKPEPFVAGFYDGSTFISIWGADCVSRMVEAIKRKYPDESLIIYAHNGGRFDFFYFLPYLERELKIINGRIVQAHMGRHELRDSFALLPFPLAEYDKDQIDYEKFRREVREKHRDEILSYLKRDCTALHELVTAFHAEFGDYLTIGGASLRQLKKRHKFQTGSAAFDARFREHFYFGGRVQVFRSGIIRQPIQVYDVNSMYPHVMASMLHPIGVLANVDKKIRRNTCFVVAEGSNYGAFPIRTKTGLDFTQEKGRFSTTIHEWQAAEETGTFHCNRLVKTYGFDDRISFSEFVNHFYTNRKRAKSEGDKIHALFYKYVLNSAYGKFAQNPENFADWRIAPRTDAFPPPWNPSYLTDSYILWSKPSEQKHYYNVCTGASITGAARSVLLKGLSHAVDPIYCDTDSIICRTLQSMSSNDLDLGAWKLEVSGTSAAICGKKLYAIFDGNRCVKKAHKGAILRPEEIWKIAQGEVIHYDNPVPAFKLDGSHLFISRTIKRTA